MTRNAPFGARVSKGRMLALLATSALVAALAGCGTSDESEPEEAATTSAASATAQAPSAIIGTYTTSLGPSGPELSEPNPPGEWGLMVNSETEAYFQPPEGPSFPVGNPVEVSADRIVLAADPECPTQVGTPGEGIYHWSLRGDTLTFTEVQDTCRDRSFVMISKPWSRSD